MTPVKDFVPLIIRQFPIVFEPDHCGDEGWVVFDFTLKHSAHAFLYHLVLWLPQDTSRLWKRENIEVYINK